MLMTSVTKRILSWPSISRFYVGTAILTLTLWIASFQQVNEIFADTNNLYQHPYKVSNASLTIKLHIHRINQIIKGSKYAQNKEQIKTALSLVSEHENEILGKLSLISQRYLGKQEVIDNIYQLVDDWKLIRQDFFDLYLQKINSIAFNEVQLTYVAQQNKNQVDKLQGEIIEIVEFANNKAKKFSESAKSNFIVVEKAGFILIFFLLAMQVLLFRMFKKNSIKEKNTVLKALKWSNELIDSSPDAMIITTQNGNITQINISAEKLFGYTRVEFIGLNISELMPKRFLHHQEKINGFFENSSTRVMGEGRELFALKKSGEVFQVEISLNLAELNNNKVAITSIRDVTKQKHIESKVLHQANYDFLTQLPNRFLSVDRLATSLEHAKRNKTKLAVMYIDLDDFKKANDIFGHHVGDKILVSAAARLKNAMRAVDTVGRFGGDEFFVLIDHFSSQDSLITVANNILEAFKKPFNIGPISTLLSASIGISVYPDDGHTVDDLLVNADLSMYQSKKVGKNSFTFFENSMRDSIKRQSSLEKALKSSLERNEFYVVYQPKYEISSNIIIGFEALVRWDNTEFAGTGPDEFIPVLEQIGLIYDVGMFVLDHALQMIKKWQSMTQQPLQMAVNISPMQFNDPMLFQQVMQKLTKYDLAGHSLEIEITEGIILEATQALKDTLNDFRKADITIALDDFGTGYSSLSYIKDYPINSIKIDKSFIEEINKNKTQTKLVKAMISLAHSLNFHVTAEGIECKEQLDFLKALKCDIAQGYYLSRPLTADKVIYLL
ncbi:MAG: diguanylate cyclase (GGDEF)-like protein/PAS domain S-box-containing protein [Alteromonadaceae bacterium]|jgi:diguanylate cyclase (GGDEF)-like protein/PAS domain S-box-containing protein